MWWAPSVISKSSMAIRATKNSMTKKQTMTLLPFESEVYPIFPDIPHLLLYYSRGPVLSAARQTGICAILFRFAVLASFGYSVKYYCWYSKHGQCPVKSTCPIAVKQVLRQLINSMNQYFLARQQIHLIERTIVPVPRQF